MEINLFRVLGQEVVDFMTADERKTIDELSARLSNNPEFEKRLRAEFIQAHLNRVKAHVKDAQDYASSVTSSFAK